MPWHWFGVAKKAHQTRSGAGQIVPYHAPLWIKWVSVRSGFFFFRPQFSRVLAVNLGTGVSRAIFNPFSEPFLGISGRRGRWGGGSNFWILCGHWRVCAGHLFRGGQARLVCGATQRLFQKRMGREQADNTRHPEDACLRDTCNWDCDVHRPRSKPPGCRGVPA